jgi:regulatory protein
MRTGEKSFCVPEPSRHRGVMSPPSDAPPSDAPPPDATSLREAALSYLARYASTEAALRRVLLKRIDRWARLQADAEDVAVVVAAAREAIQGVIAGLVSAGALSDEGFAKGRARSLTRTGRSRRAIQARLMAKGVAPGLARSAAGDDAGTELGAALILARRRRIGPFRGGETALGHGDTRDLAAARRRELGMFARAGFARGTAEQALDMDAEEALRRIEALRLDATLPD